LGVGELGKRWVIDLRKRNRNGETDVVKPRASKCNEGKGKKGMGQWTISGPTPKEWAKKKKIGKKDANNGTVKA